MELRVHEIIERTFANGPGARFAIWVQGCTLACPGCFNPSTHSASESGARVSIAELLRRIKSQEDTIDGITLSGGEPLQQPEAVAALLSGIRETTNLGILLFTGFTPDEIDTNEKRRCAVQQVDALIAGRYEAPNRIADGLRGSSNKQIILRTNRYTIADIEKTPKTEIIIEASGEVKLTGIRPLVNRGVFA